jgi:hypothetical protein
MNLVGSTTSKMPIQLAQSIECSQHTLKYKGQPVTLRGLFSDSKLDRTLLLKDANQNGKVWKWR